MNFLDYSNGIHSDCGNYVVENDIIVTQFYTKEYCRILVDLFDQLKEEFVDTKKLFNDQYPNQSLFMEQVSGIWYKKYAEHVKLHIKPIVDECYMFENNYRGVFPPFINSYSPETQKSMILHCDSSNVSMIVKLNDDYDGGDVVFPRQNFKTTDLPVGSAVLFPGTVTHPHMVEDVTAGQRYSMVGFSVPPDWNSSNVIFF